MLTASKSCCKFTIFEVSGCLSLSVFSLSLSLSYYLSCIVFFIPLWFFAFVYFVLLLLFFVLSLKFFPLHVANCHDLRPVPYIGFQFTLPTSGGNKSFQYSALYSAIAFYFREIAFCFLSSFYLALQQLRLVAFGLSTVLLRSGANCLPTVYLYSASYTNSIYTVYTSNPTCNAYVWLKIPINVA